MDQPPEAIAAKAAELRALFAEVVAALADRQVLEAVARIALGYPEIAWEPVALVAAVINARRDLNGGRSAPCAAIPEAVALPPPPATAAAAGAVLLQLPRGFI